MSDENNRENQDSTFSQKSLNFVSANNFLGLILKLISVIYYLGIFFTTLIFIPYFIYIKYIPNMQTGFIFDGFIFIVLISGLFGAALFIMGFPGIYYLTIFDEQIKNEQKNYEGKGFDEKIINKHRNKFSLINSIVTGFYLLFLLIIIQYFSFSDFIFILLILIALIAYLFFISLPIFSKKDLESKKESSKLKIKDKIWKNKKIYSSYLFIYFLYLLFLTVLVAKLFPIFLIFFQFNIALIFKVLIFCIALLVFVSSSNAILFNISALFKNRENRQYIKKYLIQDISVPLIIFLLSFIFLKLYKYPFYYFKLGSFQKKVIVNKSGLSVLKFSGYPNKLIAPYVKKDTYCNHTGRCFMVKSYILSDIGRDVYLSSNFKSKEYQKNQKLKTRIYDKISKKDFIFKSYKNSIAK